MLILPRRTAELDASKLFATTLYTGNGATQTITNALNLAGKGGLVWGKQRSGTELHGLFDTARGATKRLSTNTTDGENVIATSLTGFTASGFTLGSSSTHNASGQTYAAWSFCQSPNFFDVVEFSVASNSSANRRIPHSLGITPGLIIVKTINSYGTAWWVWHRSISNANNTLRLDLNNGEQGIISPWGVGHTATDFGINDYQFELGGRTHIAYVFAHDPSASGIIQCGGYNGNGFSAGPTVTLGWQPQWLLIKRRDSAGDWWIYDDKRATANPRIVKLLANSSAAEDTSGEDVDFLSTGFQIKDSAAGINAASGTYAYVAIRSPS